MNARRIIVICITALGALCWSQPALAEKPLLITPKTCETEGVFFPEAGSFSVQGGYRVCTYQLTQEFTDQVLRAGGAMDEGFYIAEFSVTREFSFTVTCRQRGAERMACEQTPRVLISQVITPIDCTFRYFDATPNERRPISECAALGLYSV
jgi:hypothetical protein